MNRLKEEKILTINDNINNNELNQSSSTSSSTTSNQQPTATTTEISLELENFDESLKLINKIPLIKPVIEANLVIKTIIYFYIY